MKRTIVAAAAIAAAAVAAVAAALVGPGRSASDQPDHPMPTGGQQRHQGSPDGPARPGDRDGEARARCVRPAVGPQVSGQLFVAVGEHPALYPAP